jgi:hypothetical protein
MNNYFTTMAKNKNQNKKPVHIPQIGSIEDRERAGTPVPDKAGSMS